MILNGAKFKKKKSFTYKFILLLEIVRFCIVTVFNCQNTTGHSDYMPCTAAAVFQHITVEIKSDGAVDH